MNSVVEIAIVGAIVAAACIFVGVKLAAALRGKKPSCCSDGDAVPKAGACGGCTGCGQETRRP